MIDAAQARETPVKKDSARPPYVSGTVWVEGVADYLLELIPNLMESGLTDEELYFFLMGHVHEDTWY